MLIIWRNLDLNFSYFLGGMTFRVGFFDQVFVPFYVRIYSCDLLNEMVTYRF